MGSCCVQVLMLILRNEYIEHFFFLVSLGVCVCVCVYIYIYIYIYDLRGQSLWNFEIKCPCE